MDTGIAFISFLRGQVWALPFMKFASFLGDLEFYLLFITAIYWWKGWPWA